MPWLLCMFLARHLLVEFPIEIGVKIIIYRRQWEFQSMLRCLRSAVMKKKKKATAIIFVKIFQTSKISVKPL